MCHRGRLGTHFRAAEPVDADPSGSRSGWHHAPGRRRANVKRAGGHGPRIEELDVAQLGVALDWAADEGWNPGLHDAAAFHAADPHGFLGLFVDDELVVTVSIVRYDASFAFAGCYICRPDHRGEGLGLALAEAALARSESVTVGLDGVIEQEHNYERLGFVTAYRNVRFGGEAQLGAATDTPMRVLGAGDVEMLTRFERETMVFPSARRGFLDRWVSAPGAVALAMGGPTETAGYGVIRPCRTGHKIGPLFSTDRESAVSLVAALARAVGGEDRVPRRAGAELGRYGAGA